MMRAARPAAFGVAPQGTQYSMRTRWVGLIAMRGLCHCRCSGGRAEKAGSSERGPIAKRDRAKNGGDDRRSAGAMAGV